MIFDEVRLTMIRSSLERLHVDMWCFFRPEELVMALGYQPCWGLSIALIPVEGDVLLIVPENEPEDILPSYPGLTVERVPIGTPGTSDMWRRYRDLMDDFSRGVPRGGRSRCVVARYRGNDTLPVFAAENPPIPYPFVDWLYNTFSCSVDADDEWESLFAVKTSRDLSGIRLAQTAAAVAVQTFYAVTAPGRSEAEVASAVEASVQPLINDRDIVSARAWATVQAGARAAQAGAFSRSSGACLRPGDCVVLELGVCVNGYWADITRTAFVDGPRSEGATTLFRLVETARTEATAACRSGLLMSDLYRLVSDLFTKHGVMQLFPHHLGHGVGLRYHDPGCSLVPGHDTPLRPGMVITIEPGLYDPTRAAGFRIEDNVLITNEGYDVLSNALHQTYE